MIRLFVALDLPTAAEAAVAAKQIGPAGAGLRLGSRLLARVGPMAIASLRESGSVMVDARVAGEQREAMAAVRALAAYGAAVITVDQRLGVSVLEGLAEAAAPYGATLVAVGMPPEAADPPEGRGRAVSIVARRLADTRVTSMLGRMADIGVVAQVAPELGVVVSDAATPAEVGEALDRGAVGAVIDGGIARSRDPRVALQPYLEAIGAPDTIARGGA